MSSDFSDWTVLPEDSGRLDVFLMQRFVALSGEGEMSRARMQALIKEGYVKLNGSPSLNPAKKVREGEIYTLEIPATEDFEVVGENIPLDILFEDGDLLVVNKAAGLTVHPAPGHWTGTLVHALVHHCGEELSGINGVARPGIVHRLDKDTSGIMVVAKTDKAHRGLAKQLANHSMHRIYEALCRGAPLPRTGTIEGNIGRNPTDRIKRAVVSEGGKEAVTHYEVLESFNDTASRVKLQLETGRTHQIRVHMAAKGWPVLGDSLYGKHILETTQNWQKIKDSKPMSSPRVKPLTEALQALDVPRQMLHARELGFVHPVTEETMFFKADLPADMLEIIKALST